MRIMLVAEGEHELSGTVDALIRRIVQREIREIVPYKMSSTDVRTTSGKGHALMKRAVAWIRKGEREDFDAVVLLVDQDDEESRVDAIRDAQASDISNIRRALGVAIRTIEAWLLADQTALSWVLMKQVATQQDPEKIRDPKKQLRQIIDDSPTTSSRREIYASIAAKAKLEILVKRCPLGFKDFADRLRSLDE